MASSFEKSVKGGTKIKLAAPKSKYVEHILVATHAGEAGVAEVFRVLQNRLRDTTWTIVFKSLIIIHFMIREGEQDVTLKHLAQNPHRKLAINHFTEVQTQGRNIRIYTEYILQRAVSYGTTKVDYVRQGEGRLKKLSVEKGLLRETESLQEVIKALVKCDFMTVEPENDITLTALRLLTSDLLALFHAMNEGMINILEHYFELSRPDAKRALAIYQNFVSLTKASVSYFATARQYELSTGVNVPKIKHAPVTLASSLEDYLNDPDFEINRRQYIAEQAAKKNGKGSSAANSKALSDFKPKTTQASSGGGFPSPKAAQATTTTQQAKGPGPDLIDFFESIEQDPSQFQQTPYQQQAAFNQQQPQSFPAQNNGFAPQQQFNNAPQMQGSNPFGPPQPIQANPTGAGFGGYTPQPQSQQQFMPQQTGLQSIPQNGVPNFQQPNDMFPNQLQTQGLPQIQTPSDTMPAQGQIQPQSTNPFRQSMMPAMTGASPTTPFSNGAGLVPQRTSTNPFAKPAQSAFAQAPQLPQQQPQQQQNLQPLQPAQTGTNPFARQPSPNTGQQGLAPPSSLAPNVTGSTNPFRQSTFVNQTNGQGWQTGQGSMGGLEQLETVPVFPRPGQQ